MSKQGILEILNLEDSGPTCAFAIERSRGVLSAAVPEQFTLQLEAAARPTLLDVNACIATKC